MPREYQPFSISNFRTGFNEALEPWLLPRDAFQSMVNAHLYRGVLEKVLGYSVYATMSNRNIMSLGTADGSTTTFTVTLSTLPTTTNFFAYGTIVTGVSAEKFSYISDGTSPTINLMGTANGTGTVNMVTGVATIMFNTPPPSGSPIFIIWDSAVIDGPFAIMGIKQYFNPNGSQQILVFDQRRLGVVVGLMGTIVPLQEGANYGISELPHDFYNASAATGPGPTFSGTLAGAPFVPGTVVFTEYTSTGAPVLIVVNGVTVNVTVQDNGVGGFTTTGLMVNSGSINYLTGVYTFTLSAPLPTGNYFDATGGVYGDLFTGSISNFFSLVNYQDKAFFTNNIDPIFYYDGSSIHYLNTSLETQNVTATGGVPNNFDIKTCLHVFIYQSMLLLISVNINGSPQLSTIYWSTIFEPLNFTNNDFLPASTSQPIRAIGYINTDLVVRFSNSERVFRFTGDAFDPFRFDSTNNIWACDASYSSINYDTWFSSVGRPAIVGSDAVNVRRVDEIIPDFTQPTELQDETPVPYMSQTSIMQCYGERFDDIKEGWLCYNSSPQDETTVTASDHILAFNYLDSTYAVYDFPFSCLGLGRIFNVATWGTTVTTWGSTEATWGSYQLQNNALIDLAGDQYDTVYELNDGATRTVAGDPTLTPDPVKLSVFTKNFNPFIEQGELCRFGYLDLFVTANQTSTLRVQFYLNDELKEDANGFPTGFYQETKLVFTPTDAMSPTASQVKVWKRIYIGAVGKTHTIRFYQHPADFTEDTFDQPIWIHAMVLYMKPAGRIFN